MEHLNFIQGCYDELVSVGWVGERLSKPLIRFLNEGKEIAILSYFGGDLYGLVIQPVGGEDLYVDQFVTFRMALDFGRTFKDGNES